MKSNFLILILVSLTILSCVNDDDLDSVMSPVVYEITPELSLPGSEITISGLNFNNNTVALLNGKTLEISIISDTTITLDIPEDASSGNLEIGFDQSVIKEEVYLKIGDPNWEQLSIGAYVQIEFVSNIVGFAKHGGNDKYIDKTIDGGDTWTNVLQVSSTSSPLEVVSESVAYIATGLDMIKKTTDGGNTWQEVNSLAVEYSIEKLFFKNELEGLLLAGKLGKSYIFKTEDGANTWNEVLEISTPTNKIELAYHNDNSAYLLNKENSQFIKTEDNGINWSTSDFSIITDGNPIKYDFINKNNAWAYLEPLIANPGGLFMTDDAGATWVNIETPVPSGRIANITFLNELTGYLVTNEGMNMYTIDGGITWKVFHTKDSEIIQAVTSFDKSLYISRGGYLYKQTIN